MPHAPQRRLPQPVPTIARPRRGRPSTPVARVDLRAENLVRLQRLAGNQAVQGLVQRPAAPVPVQRAIVTIGSEKVRVANDEEKTEAEAIIKRIKDNYGIELSSQTTVDALKSEYSDVPNRVKKKLRTRRWRMRELRALETALGYYAPILGAERAKSTRAAEAQEVTSVGKVKFSIDEDTPAGKLDPDTLGEYFATKKNMGLFKPSEGHHEVFKTEQKELVATFVHETGHGLLTYALKDFIAASGYWKDEDTKLSRRKRTESPPTDYGKTNAEEDLCDTAAMFFIDRKRLEKKCPKRCAFMVKLGNAWLPPPKASPVLTPAPGLPTPQPVGAGAPAGGK